MYLDFLLVVSVVVGLSISEVEPYETLWAVFPLLVAQGLWLKAVIIASAVWYDEPYAFTCLFVAYALSWIPEFGLLSTRPGFFTGRESSNTFRLPVSGKLLFCVLGTVGAAFIEDQTMVMYVTIGLGILLAMYRRLVVGYFVLGLAASVTAFFLDKHIFNYVAAYAFSKSL